MDSFYYGYHITGGNNKIILSLKTLKEKGANFAQFFTSSPQAKQPYGLVDKFRNEAPEIKKFCKENEIKLVIHSMYLLNFAKELEDNKGNFNTIFNDLIISDMVGSIGCVFHVGKYLKDTVENAENNMFKSLKKIIAFIKEKKIKSKLILETAAGQGTELFVTSNNTIKPFSDFYNKFSDNDKNYLKVCIDTCHIFSAGICLNTKDNLKKFTNELKEDIGLNNICLFHLNDSKVCCGKKVDRHEVLGYGYIKLSSLKYLIKFAKYYNIPCVLETKPDDNHIEELNLIKETIF